MKEKYLELSIGWYLFDETARIGEDANLITQGMPSIMQLGIEDYKNIKYNILYDTVTILISEININDKIKLIAFNKIIIAVILNINYKEIKNLHKRLTKLSIYEWKRVCNKLITTKNFNESKLLNKAYAYKDNKNNFWKKLLNKAYRHTIVSKDTWKELKLKNYNIISYGRQVDLYIKRDKNGNKLLGFLLYNNYYNYFTDEIYSHFINKPQVGNIDKCILHINNNEKITIKNSDIVVSTIRLMIELYNKYKDMTYNRQINYDCKFYVPFVEKSFNVLDFKIVLDTADRLESIQFNDNNIDKIELEDIHGETVNIKQFITKLKMLDEQRYKNEYLGNIAICIEEDSEYKYKIEFDN